jgi:2-oxoglutarate ferredoxin oxidoreductase subunit beta
LLFGTSREKGLRMNAATLQLEVIALGQDGVTERDVAVHDERNRGLAAMLLALRPPRFPMALGVIFCDPAATYEEQVYAQIPAGATAANAEIAGLLHQGHTWTVAG